MKQIKTVIRPFALAAEFDKQVNGFLSEGWELKKRGMTYASGEPNEVGSCATIQVLYAELERQQKPFPEEITL